MVAKLGERVGRVLIHPRTKVGAGLALVAAGAMALTSNSDLVSHPSRNDCAAHPLRNVYRPWRLHVVRPCVTATVTIATVSLERDGDLHVDVKPDDPSLVNDLNRRQHGYLLIEFVPGDPRPAQLHPGDRLTVKGTLVEDLQHGPAAPGCREADWPCGGRKRGWRELHPVFDVVSVRRPR